MKKLRFWIGMAISLIALVWAFQNIHLAEVWTELQKIHYLLLVPSFLLVLFSLWARAVRWRLLFHPTPYLNLLRFFFIVNIGYLANNLLPLRAGEFVRAYLVGNAAGISKARAISTVLVERVMDTMVVVLFLVLVAPFLPSLPNGVHRASIVVGISVLALVIALVILSKPGLVSYISLLYPVIWPSAS